MIAWVRLGVCVCVGVSLIDGMFMSCACEWVGVIVRGVCGCDCVGEMGVCGCD